MISMLEELIWVNEHNIQYIILYLIKIQYKVVRLKSSFLGHIKQFTLCYAPKSQKKERKPENSLKSRFCLLHYKP